MGYMFYMFCLINFKIHNKLEWFISYMTPYDAYKPQLF